MTRTPKVSSVADAAAVEFADSTPPTHCILRSGPSPLSRESKARDSLYRPGATHTTRPPSGSGRGSWRTASRHALSVRQGVRVSFPRLGASTPASESTKTSQRSALASRAEAARVNASNPRITCRHADMQSISAEREKKTRVVRCVILPPPPRRCPPPLQSEALNAFFIRLLVTVCLSHPSFVKFLHFELHTRFQSQGGGYAPARAGESPARAVPHRVRGVSVYCASTPFRARGYETTL